MEITLQRGDPPEFFNQAEQFAPQKILFLREMQG
jgi:hypothetical protein